MIPPPRRRRIVHVVQNLRVGSITTHIWDVITFLRDYHHTVLFEGSILEADKNLLGALAEAGADVLHVTSAGGTHKVGPLPHGEVTPDMLREGQYDAAILHSLVGHAGLGKAIPSIYYSYGVHDSTCLPDITVCCSEYAMRMGRHGPHAQPLPQGTVVVAPGVPARRLRRRPLGPKQFTVGLLNSGCFGQYPLELVRYLMSHVNRDSLVYVSVPDRYLEEMKHIATTANRSANLMPVQAFPGRQILHRFDVLIQGYAPGYNSPYSKSVIEAMCMGIPVLCQRSGFLATQLIENQHCLFFDNKHEAVEKLHALQHDRTAAEALGLNGRDWAFTQDQSVYMNEIRSLLRDLGA